MSQGMYSRTIRHCERCGADDAAVAACCTKEAGTPAASASQMSPSAHWNRFVGQFRRPVGRLAGVSAVAQGGLASEPCGEVFALAGPPSSLQALGGLHRIRNRQVRGKATNQLGEVNHIHIPVTNVCLHASIV